MYKYECPNCFGTVKSLGKQKEVKCNWCGEKFKPEDNNEEIQEEIKKEENKTIDFSKMTSYGDGQYLVGNDIKSGEYLVIATNYASGYFCICTDPNGDDIIENSASFTYAYLKVNNGEFLKLSNTNIYHLKDNDLDRIQLLFNEQGRGIMLRVGIDISAGTYKLTTNKNGYYAIYDGPICNGCKIINNDCFNGNTYVQVRNGQYLLLSDGTNFL